MSALIYVLGVLAAASLPVFGADRAVDCLRALHRLDMEILSFRGEMPPEIPEELTNERQRAVIGEGLRPEESEDFLELVQEQVSMRRIAIKAFQRAQDVVKYQGRTAERYRLTLEEQMLISDDDFDRMVRGYRELLEDESSPELALRSGNLFWTGFLLLPGPVVQWSFPNQLLHIAHERNMTFRIPPELEKLVVGSGTWKLYAIESLAEIMITKHGIGPGGAYYSEVKSEEWIEYLSVASEKPDLFVSVVNRLMARVLSNSAALRVSTDPTTMDRAYTAAPFAFEIGALAELLEVATFKHLVEEKNEEWQAVFRLVLNLAFPIIIYREIIDNTDLPFDVIEVDRPEVVPPFARPPLIRAILNSYSLLDPNRRVNWIVAAFGLSALQQNPHRLAIMGWKQNMDGFLDEIFQMSSEQIPDIESIRERILASLQSVADRDDQIASIERRLRALTD